MHIFFSKNRNIVFVQERGESLERASNQFAGNGVGGEEANSIAKDADGVRTRRILRCRRERHSETVFMQVRYDYIV